MYRKTLPHDHGHLPKGLQMEMPQGQTFEILSDLFKMMSDSKRIQIFWLLCHCEECVMNISALVEMSSPAVSHHLKLLKAAGLITSRREGKEVYYKAADTELCQLLHRAIEETMQLTCPMAKGLDHAEPKDAYMRKIHDYLLENLDQRITTQTLSRTFTMNPTTLKARFKQAYGHSIAAHMQLHRMERAAALLKHSDLTVQEISGQVGYASQSKFATVFRQTYGLSPLEYRKKQPT